MKILALFLILFSSVIESKIPDVDYKPRMEMPCEDFKQYMECVENAKEFSEFKGKCECFSCQLYGSQVGEKIGGACDREYDMSAETCVFLLSWISKAIAISQCNNHMDFKEFHSCYIKRHSEMIEMMLQTTQEQKCQLFYKSLLGKIKKDRWFKRLKKKILSVF